MKQTLQETLKRRQAVPIVGVHDAISAILAERQGFDALWLSGFGLSTVHGLRDANELPWEQVLRTIDYIAHATDARLLVDADTGYGDFNTARHFARRALKFGAAGICIEDKRYPKLNSFVEGLQCLEDPKSFAGKIQAIRDSTGEDLCVVARTEALIAGGTMQEALDRANIYAEAGADAILVQSKRANFDQVEQFMHQWRDRAPVVIVPTTYDATPVDKYLQCRVAGVIWANQALRASVQVMREVYGALYQEGTPVQVRELMVGMKDIFELVDIDELLVAEEKYAV